MTWFILASGQSLTQKQVDLVKKAKEEGKISGVGAISNVALDFAPWADFMVSHDNAWWDKNPNAINLQIDKYSRHGFRGTKKFIPKLFKSCNSGIMGMEIAHKIYKANRLCLLGFDMHGTHYFGKYENGLRNSNDNHFQRHIRQFLLWSGPPVINCTPNSALKNFPFIDIEEVL